MEFRCKQSMQGDCLWLNALAFRKILQFKTARFILAVAIATHLFTLFFELSVFFIHPEYFLQYAPLLFARTYGFFAATAVLLTRNVTEELWNAFDKWALDSVGLECPQECKRVIFVSNCVTMAFLGLIALLLAFYLQNSRSDPEYYLIMLVFKESCPNYSGVFNFSIKLLLAPLYFAMVVHAMQLGYSAQHSRMQLHMWVVNFKRIVADYPKGEGEEMLADEEYQEEICRRLVFSIERIIYMLQFRRISNEKVIQRVFVGYICSGFIFGISVALLIYESHQGAYQHNDVNAQMLIWIFLLIFCLLFCYLFYYGQQIENSVHSEEIRNVLTQTKWYYFNRRNRVNLLMFWLILSQPIRLEFSTDFAINYPLGLKVVKGLYSVISLIAAQLHKE